YTYQAAVTKLPTSSTAEKVRRANGYVGLRALLRLIAQIGEIVTLPLRSLAHVSEVVLGVARLVIRVDHHELNALSGEIFLDRNRAILPRLHIGTVVAPEGDQEDGLVLDRGE